MKRPFIAASHPAHCSLAARACLLLFAALACMTSGLLLYAQDSSRQRMAAENRRAALQAELGAALTKAATLPELRRREGELAMRLAKDEEQLWPEGGDANGVLQAKLARRAEECGLSLESFRPLPPSGAARPSAGSAEISVSGGYAQLLRFVELVSAPPKSVLIDAMEIVRAERESGPVLVMTATVGIIRIANDKEGKP